MVSYEKCLHVRKVALADIEKCPWWNKFFLGRILLSCSVVIIFSYTYIYKRGRDGCISRAQARIGNSEDCI